MADITQWSLNRWLNKYPEDAFVMIKQLGQ